MPIYESETLQLLTFWDLRTYELAFLACVSLEPNWEVKVAFCNVSPGLVCDGRLNWSLAPLYCTTTK